MSAPPDLGLRVVAARGVPEVRPGDDLAALLTDAWHHADTRPRDGDVLVVTSKVVSKAEGRVLTGPDADKDRAVEAETDREVARRGPTRIVRTRHGFVMAGAGVDASNVDPGALVLLPRDPDASARRLREAFQRRGACVGVVVSDTSGRAWRAGQTDIALGAAGLVVLDDHAGRLDRYGNTLAVTAPAIADEVAAAAELVSGKLSGSPACLLRGLERFVLPPGDHGHGARQLVRPEEQDMFGLGAREAVLAALASDAARHQGTQGSLGPRGFGAAADTDEVARALALVVPDVVVHPLGQGRLELRLPADAAAAARAEERTRMLLVAHGWRADPPADGVMVAGGGP